MNRYLKDYILREGGNVTRAAVLASLDCEDGDTLLLGGGELHFYPDNAYEKFCAISNNSYGTRSIVFPLIEKKRIRVNGEGARLIFHGRTIPFAIDSSEDITLLDLSIDYAEPIYFSGEIVAADENFVEMEYDEGMFHCEIENDRFIFSGENWRNECNKVLVNEFDPVFKGPTPTTITYFAHLGEPPKNAEQHAALYRFVKASKPSHNRLRLEGAIGYVHTVGKHWLCTHNGRDCPAIFACDSARLSVQNVTLYHSLAMGIICQTCEDVTLFKVCALPNDDRLLSVNADSTHFVNCSGTIRMEKCQFESMMDDATNIHGIYMPIAERIDDHNVLLSYGHIEQKGVNIFRNGDIIRLVDNNTLHPYQEFTVESSEPRSVDYLLLTVREVLPQKIPTGHVFENHTRMPEVYISECECGYNRPRGFLLSTCRRAVVEKCRFYNLHYAIAIMGDANSWYESGPCGEVILRDNIFDRSAYSGRPVIVASPALLTHTDKPYHGTLIVENNTFRTNGRHFMKISSFEKVVFRNNTYEPDDSFGVKRDADNGGFDITNCKNCDIEKL